MFSKLKSCGLVGIDGFIVEVETDISNGIPSFEIVGLGDTAIRESKERTRAAIKNTGMEFPVRRITLNLSPASLKKEGSSFDLAVALGILVASGQVDGRIAERCMFVGELSLNGEIKPVHGVLPMAVCAKQNGVEYLVLPEANANEATVVKGIAIISASTLKEVIEQLNGKSELKCMYGNINGVLRGDTEYSVDFADVKGQENVKRALEVAASGGHNCIMVGSPGSGKTMLAVRLPTILPAMTFEEALEVSKIHSIAGIMPQGKTLLTNRPFRNPHHTISDAGLVGGGSTPKPGEISLAHYGVLFLDELPEFSKKSLEVLRQPLEDGIITITRANSSLTYPARTTLVCAANPCKCGRFLEAINQCTCTPKQVQDYIGKLSGPLLDRMDIHIEVASVKYNELETNSSAETSMEIRKRVDKARRIQLERYKGLNIYSNSQLQSSMLNKYCRLDEQGKKLLRQAFEKLGLSARAHGRILKVARTIADMDMSNDIKPQHIAEAIQYRSLDRKIWNI